MEKSERNESKELAKMSGTKKKLLLITISLIAVLLIGGILFWLFSPKYPDPQSAMTVVQGADKTYVFQGDRNIVELDSGTCVYNYNLSHNTMFIYGSYEKMNDIDWKKVDVKTLDLSSLFYNFYITGARKINIGESGDLANLRCLDLSSDGNYLFYTNRGKGLFVKNMSSGQSWLSKQDPNSVILSGVVSPNGQIIAYNIDNTSEENGLSFETILEQSGREPLSLGENILAFGVADEGSTVYYVQPSEDDEKTGHFFVRYNDQIIPLGVINWNDSIYFNCNMSEVVYSSAGNVCYYKLGQESRIIAQGKLSQLYDQDIQSVKSTMGIYTPDLSGTQSISKIVVDVESFANYVWQINTDDMLKSAFFQGDGSWKILDASNYILSEDKTSLITTDDLSTAVFYKDLNNTDSQPERCTLPDTIIGIVPSPDFASFFLTDITNKLWFWVPGQVAKGVAVNTIYNGIGPLNSRISFSYDQKYAYVLIQEDHENFSADVGTLYVFENGKEGELIEIAQNVYSVNILDSGVYYASYTDSTKSVVSVGYSSNGLDFRILVQDIPVKFGGSDIFGLRSII